MPAVTLIPGDGVGPEVASAARSVIDHVVNGIDWEVVDAGAEAFRRTGRAVPDRVVESLARTRVGLKGPMTVPDSGYSSPNTEIRERMGLWCNMRRATSFGGGAADFTGTDVLVVRDVTEDLGRGVSQHVGPDAGVALKVVTRLAAHRLAEFAFTYAAAQGISQITIPHQAPTNRSTDGLFVSEVMDVASRHPGLTVTDEAMDVVCMHLCMHPQRYQMLLCQNFYGGILTGLCSGLVGGVGLIPGVNLDDRGTAVFEAGHGSAPKYAGLDKVNPTGLILSGALLLEHIGEFDAARAVQTAVRTVLADGQNVTYDQGGSASLSDFTQAVVRAIDKS
ncbi:isocitrate/isopropylmalate family dehydrogenase [Pseudonocardia sp. GCM10023141]|uniref:isocitrate/isopropylmalate family dehydrogenase n=1 Tax=Pseudonocardia sp. GCM10023141 TaxID=3252653 RepID=UPI00361EF8A5